MGKFSTAMETITNLKRWSINGKKGLYKSTSHKAASSQKYKVLMFKQKNIQLINGLMNWVDISTKKKYK